MSGDFDLLGFPLVPLAMLGLIACVTDKRYRSPVEAEIPNSRASASNLKFTRGRWGLFDHLTERTTLRNMSRSAAITNARHERR
jgi:hypothetical protein